MSASSGGTGNVVAAKFPGPGKEKMTAFQIDEDDAYE